MGPWGRAGSHLGALGGTRWRQLCVLRAPLLMPSHLSACIYVTSNKDQNEITIPLHGSFRQAYPRG